MLARINRLLNRIELKVQSNNTVFVSGIDAYTFVEDVSKVWRTSKFMKHMFRSFSSSGFSIHNFYLPDFVYMCRKITEEKGTRSNKRMLHLLIDKIMTETWMQSTLEKAPELLDFSRLKNLKVTPLPHQMEFFQIFNENVSRYRLQGYLLAAGAGGGKTISALTIQELLNADAFIAMCPKNTMRSAWEADAHKALKDPAVASAFWSDEDHFGDWVKSEKFYFLHYEAMGLLREIVRKHSKKKRIVIALDESHNFNDIKAQRTQNLVNVITEMRKAFNVEIYVVFMSGTPLKQVGAEMVPFLQCVDPMFVGPVVESFKSIYGLTSSRANDILRNRLGMLMHIVPKDAIRKAAAPIVEDISIQLKNGKDYTIASIRDAMAVFVRDRLKYYKDNEKRYLADYEEGVACYAATVRSKGEQQELDLYKKHAASIRKSYDPVADKDKAMYCNSFEKNRIIPCLTPEQKVRFRNAKSVYKYVGLKIQGEALARVLGEARIRCHVDMAAVIDFEKYINASEGKVLIFTSYVQVVEKVTNDLTDGGFLPEPIYGKTNKNINQILKRLRDDDDAGPAVATFDSLAEGVPMLMCNTGLFLNNPWRSSDEVQAISRMDRIGQTRQVYIFRFVLDTGAEGNVSTRSQEIMELSRSMVEEILGVSYGTAAGTTEYQQALAMEGYDKFLTEDVTGEISDVVTPIRNAMNVW